MLSFVKQRRTGELAIHRFGGTMQSWMDQNPQKIRPCHTEIKMAADIFERVLWSRPLQLTSFFVASLCCLDTGLLFQTVPFGRFVFDELFRDFLLYMIVYLRMHVDWPNLSGNTWYQQQIQLDLLIFLDVQHSKWWILLSHVYIYMIYKLVDSTTHWIILNDHFLANCLHCFPLKHHTYWGSHSHTQSFSRWM